MIFVRRCAPITLFFLPGSDCEKNEMRSQSCSQPKQVIYGAMPWLAVPLLGDESTTVRRRWYRRHLDSTCFADSVSNLKATTSIIEPTMEENLCTVHSHDTNFNRIVLLSTVNWSCRRRFSGGDRDAILPRRIFVTTSPIIRLMSSAGITEDSGDYEECDKVKKCVENTIKTSTETVECPRPSHRWRLRNR